MPVNLHSRNRPLGPLVRAYGPDDVILYALGVGAGFSDLEYCYEKQLKVIPTFSAAMIFDLFFEAVKAAELNP
ncbi:MAG: short-chain dehydrogenase, partial [Desulfococcaceae bacterium]